MMAAPFALVLNVKRARNKKGKKKKGYEAKVALGVQA